MNDNIEFRIASLLPDIKRKVNDAKKALKKVGYDTKSISDDVFADEKPISIVFAGQYSAGKSSILKMLTGYPRIEIGVGITTQTAQKYDWNGINVVDTPGIHTTLRPDHDEISYEAIKESDLLIYVVTQELFDDYIGKNFRRLLIDYDKAGEMLLIVNKMADIGNTKANQEIKLQDLEKVTSPYKPSDLRTVFIDANSFLDSKTEEDLEIAQLLYERSNYETLIEELNDFIAEKGLTSRLTTVLYNVLDIVEKVIMENKLSSGDEDIDALEEQLYQKRRIIFDARRNLEVKVQSIVDSATSDIRSKGREVANSIYDYKNEEDANEAIAAAYAYVESISGKCTDDVITSIEELSGKLESELDDFYNTDFSKQLQFRLNNKYEKQNPQVMKIFKSDLFTQGGTRIVSNTVGDVGANGLKAFSGSNMHELVLNVGHFFGKSFKPWEAVKWVKGISMAGKALGIFGVVFSLGMQVKDDIDSDNREKEMRSNREKLRAGFNDAANELNNHFTKMLDDYVAKYYLSEINDIDSQIEKINSLKTEKSNELDVLESAAKEIKDEISVIHSI
ncbi:50S ribosome-binding GTPase [Streptococcus parauberis]|uniref:50S ribosome-binding GTPase n=1 Tax=Streptococcus parauberis TaxID=1348 RepID=A0AAE4HZ29_9STRE|nr:LeoA/HP0731 family dynamin-like GTPase [Streptococcus parauberis]MDT2732608.1 50S ribosome-binding GTPase [Streptococcus parauberis]